MDQNTKDACLLLKYEAIGDEKRWSYKTGLTGMQLYNNNLLEISKNRGVNFVDMEMEVPKSLTYFIDDVHYSDTTFGMIGQSLAEAIIELNLVATR